MEERKQQEYIVMFPFMAQGHMIPFLALAQKIHRTRGFSVVFVSTPLNTKKLRSSSPVNSSSIRFLDIPFNASEHGLPPDTENTDSLPYNFILRLLEASMTLKPSFKSLVLDLVEQNHGRKPLCLISDMFFPWSVEISRDLGVLHAVFGGGGGYGFACYYSLWLHLPHLKRTASGEFTLPDFPEVSRLHFTQLAEHLKIADGTDSFSRFLRGILPQWKKADGLLFNSVEELDKTGLDYFRRTLNIPCWPVGPLFFSREMPNAGSISISSEAYMNWLDQKPECSVLYVSFGSQNTISASQMMQLAIALEKSCKDFIWVVRPPVGFDINSEFRSEKWLPEGFEERIIRSNKGFVVRKWASQVEILKHKSVSCFLSHCGWNSVLEALCNGVPMMAWPLAAEQFYNAKHLEEEIGVCVEVARGKSSEVRSEDIVEKIEMVMNVEGERGKKMRKRAMEVKKIMENACRDEEGFQGSSAKAMDEFLNSAFAVKDRLLLKP